MLCKLSIIAVATLVSGPLLAQSDAPSEAVDTLCVELEKPEHRSLLEPITWTCESFPVTRDQPRAGEDADCVISFPSPPIPDDPDDLLGIVYLDWYMAKDSSHNARAAPALVIIPETNSRRSAAISLARLLAARRVHAFVLQPPGYARRGKGRLMTGAADFLPRVRRTVADARRAFDAVNSLDFVTGPVGMGGISLGGFLAILTTELDDAYDSLFVFLAGVDLHGVVSSGAKDAAKFRQRFAELGFEGEKLRELLWHIEPLRGVDRIDPDRTWLFTGNFDKVVPAKSSDLFATTVGLAEDHHIRLPVNHYTGVLLLPAIAQRVAMELYTIEAER